MSDDLPAADLPSQALTVDSGAHRRRRGGGAKWLQLLVFSLGLAACAGSNSGTAASAAAMVRPLASGFVSNGQSVRVEVVPSRRPGPRPAVILLHGASGVGRGWLIYPYAQAFARRGIDAFIVHYFDGLDAAVSDRSGTRHFGDRDRIIGDAISYVGSLPDIDSQRIGLFGLSLGGFHALRRAAHDHRLAAVVNLMGAMPQSVAVASIRRMPPTLILHGGRDDVVPVERAAELALLLSRVGTLFEMKLYMNAGHSMPGPAHGNSIELAADFLDRHLVQTLVSSN